MKYKCDEGCVFCKSLDDDVFCIKGHWAGLGERNYTPSFDPWENCKDYSTNEDDAIYTEYETEKKLWTRYLLGKCISMWAWLARNPGMEKREWPGFDTMPEAISDELYISSQCALCMLDRKLCISRYGVECMSTVHNCTECPLAKAGHGCGTIDSVFTRWEENKDYDDKQEAAIEMYLIAKELMKRLDKGEEI